MRAQAGNCAEDICKRFDPDLEKLDFSQFIKVRSSQDIAETRSQLKKLIFKSKQMPTTLLTKPLVQQDPDQLGFATNAVHETFSLNMPFGIISNVHKFRPSDPNGTHVIYLQGHDGIIEHGRATIQKLLDERFTVWALAMPCLGDNFCPERVEHPRFGPIAIPMIGGWDHEALRLLRTPTFNPLSLFIAPIVATITTIKAQDARAEIAALGLSGGGWSAMLIAAMDPRVRWSFPVAGTHPEPLWFRPPGPNVMRDFEQSDPELLLTATYLEMYVLGASGKGRKQVQFFNQYDNCCFAGINPRLYTSAVANVIKDISIGGSFDVEIEADLEVHAISPQALSRIIETMKDEMRR